MTVWKITRRPYAVNPVSGEGAARFGNRWNSRGVRMVYACGSRPLAYLEMLAHVKRETFPVNVLLVSLDVPDKLISELHEPPPGWNELPFRESSQEKGDEWIRNGKSAALLVPSAVLAQEWNLLINPRHADFGKIKVQPAETSGLNSRLFQP